MAYLILGMIIGAVLCYSLLIGKVHENDNCINSYRDLVEELRFNNECLKRLNDVQQELLKKTGGK